MEHDIVLTEHKKLKEVQPLSQAVYDFLEWCGDNGMRLCSQVEGRWEGVWQPVMEGRQALLARHFEIDLVKLEREKEMLLAAQRELNKARR